MPNPYRDEIGRYASKEEMGAAVKTLEQAVMQAKSDEERHEAMGQWFALKKRYDDLVEGRVSMPAEWVNRVATSGLTAIPHEAEGQRVFYEQIRERLQDPKEPANSSAAQKAISLLREKNLPKDIRETILRDSNPGVQANILRELNKADSDAVSADLLLVVPAGRHRLDPRVAEQLMASQKLTFEQKFDIAQAGWATTSLVAANPELATQNPETEKAVLENLVTENQVNRKPGASYYSERSPYDRAWGAFAEHARTNDAHLAVLGTFASEPISTSPSAHNHPYLGLLKNRNVDEAMATNVLERIAFNDPEAFREAAGLYRQVDGRRGTKLSNALYDGLFAYPGHGVDDKAYKPFDEDGKWYLKQEASATQNAHAARVAQAHLDGDPVAFKELKRRHKLAARNKRDADAAAEARALQARIELAQLAYEAKKTMDYLAAGPRP